MERLRRAAFAALCVAGGVLNGAVLFGGHPEYVLLIDGVMWLIGELYEER